MHIGKKITTLVVAISLFLSFNCSAQECFYTGGNGYTECRTAPLLGPAIVLGAVALGAIIAVALVNSHHFHGHCCHELGCNPSVCR